MSSIGEWPCTAPCTIWKSLGKDRYGQTIGWSAPMIIMCEYQGGLSRRLSSIGTERVVKNTFWTEFADAETGDRILIGESDNPNPIEAGADEVMQSIRYADTFDRLVDDWAIITGV